MLSFHRRSIQPLIPPSTLELPLHLFTPHLYFSTCATFYSLWPVHSIYAPFSRVKRVGRKALAHQSWQPISKDDDTDGRDDAVILYSQSTLHSLIRYRNFCTLKAYIKIYCIDFLGRRINLLSAKRSRYPDQIRYTWTGQGVTTFREFWVRSVHFGQNPAEPEFFLFGAPRDLSATSQRPIVTKFGQKRSSVSRQ